MYRVVPQTKTSELRRSEWRQYMHIPCYMVRMKLPRWGRGDYSHYWLYMEVDSQLHHQRTNDASLKKTPNKNILHITVLQDLNTVITIPV